MAFQKSNSTKFKDISGNKYGKLLVLEYIGRKPIGKQFKQIFRCLCDCGNEILANSCALKSGNTKSCGCHKLARKHGMSKTRIYNIWTQMFERCYKPNNPNFKYYGARGIKICERWDEFNNFYEDMKDGYSDNLSIDRIDVNGDYEPGNCRWATNKEQQFNKRTTISLTVNGETKLLHEWLSKSAHKPSTVRARLRLGWTHEDALFYPIVIDRSNQKKNRWSNIKPKK